MNKKYLMGVLGVVAVASLVEAADHGDTPLLIQTARHDARISDLHTFTNGENLVVALTLDPNIPTTATSYRFSEDLTARIHIDSKTPVSYDNETLNKKYGGRITDPEKISSDITIEVSFDENNNPIVHADGLKGNKHEYDIKVFAGLRDDPFINGLRNRRNSASIVLELPLSAVRAKDDTMLVWATTKVPDINGPISEHGGRALRSQRPENDAMNTLTPAAHHTQLGLVPDVIILNTSKPVGFPNGRLLTDDVIDQVGEAPLINNPTAQGPTANDKPFLSTFPYLAQPW